MVEDLLEAYNDLFKTRRMSCLDTCTLTLKMTRVPSALDKPTLKLHFEASFESYIFRICSMKFLSVIFSSQMSNTNAYFQEEDNSKK